MATGALEHGLWGVLINGVPAYRYLLWVAAVDLWWLDSARIPLLPPWIPMVSSVFRFLYSFSMQFTSQHIFDQSTSAVYENQLRVPPRAGG
jgi:hypothetical protein